MVWLPGAWDERLHVRHALGTVPIRSGAVFVGTATERKREFLKIIQPKVVAGNGWIHRGPLYLHDYVRFLSQWSLAINVHRDNIGVNRRFFEMMACCFTITDRVPGVVEILGEELAAKVTFETPEEGQQLKEYFLGTDLKSEVEQLWEMEKDAIANYTYTHLAQSIIDEVARLD